MSKATMVTLKDRFDDMNEEERHALKQLHVLLDTTVENPRALKYDPVQFIEDIEYTLQGIWGFSRDRNYHIHWLRLKGCTCPQEENSFLFGSPDRAISSDCPWHKKESGND